MLECSLYADLPDEPLQPHRSGDLRPEDFEGYLTIMLLVTSEIDQSHATGSDLTDDPVAARDKLAECDSDFTHLRSSLRN
jgi:hypothetical protein